MRCGTHWVHFCEGINFFASGQIQLDGRMVTAFGGKRQNTFLAFGYKKIIIKNLILKFLKNLQKNFNFSQKGSNGMTDLMDHFPKNLTDK